MSQPLLQVKNLSIEFESNGLTVPAVKNISFEVLPGQITAIVGESGSGKSVTSLAIMKLLPEQALINGQILLLQKEGSATDLLRYSNTDINAIRGKDIAMIFQEPMTSLNPVFSCGFQVMEALQMHQKISSPEAHKKAVELFTQVDLPNPSEMMSRYPHQLSGGQKQRVMIAMAMSCNPSLLIADEPTTALDVTVQKRILDLIRNLQLQTGMSVILITHDLGIVADIAHSLVVMYKGEIVEQGQTSAILSNPIHPYTKALLACRPAMHKRGDRLPVVSDFLLQVPEAFSGRIDGSIKFSPQASIISKERLSDDSETMKGKKVLVVQNLEVYYSGKRKLFGAPTPTFKAVDDVSFTVSKGETVGLVGESGCGKTTLGRAILQLVKPTGEKQPWAAQYCS
jgi:peptide/nickel transport system ATP-binding protein